MDARNFTITKNEKKESQTRICRPGKNGQPANDSRRLSAQLIDPLRVKNH